MRSVLAITRALDDRTRLRTLLALRHGELCLCQLVELLGLAPSTVSRHVNILCDAGLLDRRKEGRWAFFRLAGRNATPAARRAIRWVTECVEHDPAVAADDRTLRRLMRKDLEQLCGCYA